MGGLFGVLEATESAAGLLGPVLGGVLLRWRQDAPVICVVLAYSIVFAAVAAYYRRHIVLAKPPVSSVAETGAGVKDGAGAGAGAAAVGTTNDEQTSSSSSSGHLKQS